MADKKELNIEEAENISGGMPNPFSMTPEEWEEWQKKHNHNHEPEIQVVYEKDADGNLIKKEIHVPRPAGATQN